MSGARGAWIRILGRVRSSGEAAPSCGPTDPGRYRKVGSSVLKITTIRRYLSSGSSVLRFKLILVVRVSPSPLFVRSKFRCYDIKREQQWVTPADVWRQCPSGRFFTTNYCFSRHGYSRRRVQACLNQGFDRVQNICTASPGSCSPTRSMSSPCVSLNALCFSEICPSVFQEKDCHQRRCYCSC